MLTRNDKIKIIEYCLNDGQSKGILEENNLENEPNLSRNDIDQFIFVCANKLVYMVEEKEL